MPHTPHMNPVQFPMVVLRHELADGSFHFDWMFARENPPTTNLITLRTCERPDECVAGQIISAERIGDHRIVYLNYEGPISRDRGSVIQVAAGRFIDIHHPDHPLSSTDVRPFSFIISWNEEMKTHQQWVIDMNSATARFTNIVL